MKNKAYKDEGNEIQDKNKKKSNKILKIKLQHNMKKIK